MSNPFELPSDEEIFRRMEAERMERLRTRERNLQASVKDKTTFSTRMGAIDVKSLSLRDKAPGKSALKEISAAAATMVADHRSRDREIMSEFIAKVTCMRRPRGGLKDSGLRKLGIHYCKSFYFIHNSITTTPLALLVPNLASRGSGADPCPLPFPQKREIFLVQMSLDTKKSEIRKLEERAAQREEALKRSKELLDQHQQKFHDFMREDREKVQMAQTKAEIQQKTKTDRLAEIKKLNQQREALNAELTKYEDQLADCKSYKDFLDKLTPVRP